MIQNGTIQLIKNLTTKLLLFSIQNKIELGKKDAIGHKAIESNSKCVPGHAPWPSWPLCNLLKKSSKNAFWKKSPLVASWIAKNQGIITTEHINIPKIGLIDLKRLKDFWNKQNETIVEKRIASETGPFTKTPNAKDNHKKNGYKYSVLKDFVLAKIIFSNKNCWMHIKLNNVESVLAKCASPIKINEEAKNKVINKLCSNEKINLVIKVKNIIVIKALKKEGIL